MQPQPYNNKEVVYDGHDCKQDIHFSHEKEAHMI